MDGAREQSLGDQVEQYERRAVDSFEAGDYRPAASQLEARTAEPERVIEQADLPALGRVVMAVLAMHRPDERGRCPICRRGWLRRSHRSCPTRAAILLMLEAEQGPATRNRDP